jgi:UDP-glucose 4-epimerase
LNILVVGGAGFIGSHFVEMYDNLDEIVVLDNFNLGKRSNLNSDVQTINADASVLTNLINVIKKNKIEIVYNFATLSLPASLQFPLWNILNNIQVVSNMCELARLNLIKEFINISTSEVYGSGQDDVIDENHVTNPLTPYAASKLGADKIVDSYINTFDIKACTIRPFNNIGPRQSDDEYPAIIPNVLKRIKQNKPIIIQGTGNQSRDFIYVKETIKSISILMKSKNYIGEIFNLGTGKETTVNQLVKSILSIVGKMDYPIIYT